MLTLNVEFLSGDTPASIDFTEQFLIAHVIAYWTQDIWKTVPHGESRPGAPLVDTLENGKRPIGFS